MRQLEMNQMAERPFSCKILYLEMSSLDSPTSGARNIPYDVRMKYTTLVEVFFFYW